MKINDFAHRIKRKWMKLRLQPIRVFCFHQVSEQFNPEVYCKPDWMSLSEFKQKIQNLKRAGYEFISLPEAYAKLTHDKFRNRKYAVLTCDDGLKCQAALIPWLSEQQIPMTMFITAKYLDGMSCGPQVLKYFNITNKESEHKLAGQLYLNEAELVTIDNPMLTIGMHGYDHIHSEALEKDLFNKHVDSCLNALQSHRCYIPFFAYPYGGHTEQTDLVLREKEIVPVLMDGTKNYKDDLCIHRELL